MFSGLQVAETMYKGRNIHVEKSALIKCEHES